MIGKDENIGRFAVSITHPQYGIGQIQSAFGDKYIIRYGIHRRIDYDGKPLYKVNNWGCLYTFNKKYITVLDKEEQIEINKQLVLAGKEMVKKELEEIKSKESVVNG